jgi:hypothetical protein
MATSAVPPDRESAHAKTGSLPCPASPASGPSKSHTGRQSASALAGGGVRICRQNFSPGGVRVIQNRPRCWVFLASMGISLSWRSAQPKHPVAHSIAAPNFLGSRHSPQHEARAGWAKRSVPITAQRVYHRYSGRKDQPFRGGQAVLEVAPLSEHLDSAACRLRHDARSLLLRSCHLWNGDLPTGRQMGTLRFAHPTALQLLEHRCANEFAPTPGNRGSIEFGSGWVAGSGYDAGCMEAVSGGPKNESVPFCPLPRIWRTGREKSTTCRAQC